jgi:putative aminopeptidase FrvX
MNRLIRTLTQTWGPTSYEEGVRGVITQALSPLHLDYKLDALGNLIYQIPCPGKPKMLLSAHMDQIGIIVTHVDKDGFLRFGAVGGLDPYKVLGQRFVFANGTVGVAAVESKEHKTLEHLTLDNLFLDIGAASKEDALSHVAVGDFAVYVGECVQIGNRVTSAALDDRIGCYVLIEALKAVAGKKLNYEVYGMFSVQEEIGIKGARVGAWGVQPDLAIALDVTAWGDTPESYVLDIALGKGPAIKVKDAGMVATPVVRDLLIETAKKHRIPFQLEVLQGGTTDAAAIQMNASGVPTGVISIPDRYVHSASEMVDLADVEGCVKLLTAVLLK